MYRRARDGTTRITILNTTPTVQKHCSRGGRRDDPGPTVRGVGRNRYRSNVRHVSECIGLIGRTNGNQPLQGKSRLISYQLLCLTTNLIGWNITLDFRLSPLYLHDSICSISFDRSYTLTLHPVTRYRRSMSNLHKHSVRTKTRLRFKRDCMNVKRVT